MSMEEHSELFKKYVAKYGKLPTEFDPRYLEMLRMSKYRILAVPDVKPAKCSNCGATKNDGRKYVDFGLEVDWYGCVFLCSHCVKDIAESLGLFDGYRREFETYRENLIDREILMQQGVTLYNDFEDAVERFKAYYASLHSTGSNSTSDSDSSVEPGKKTTGSDVSENASGSTEGKTGTSKPHPGGGSSDVPSLTDLLNIN